MGGKISFVRNKGALIGCDPQVYLYGIPTISSFFGYVSSMFHIKLCPS